jgi:tetratricopeptide (TPR) repeat protein
MRNKPTSLNELLYLLQADTVISQCKKRLKKDKDPTLYQMLAVAYSLKHDHFNTFRFHENAASLAPNDAIVHLRQGQSHVNFGETEKARECFLKAITLNEKNTMIHRHFSTIENYQKDQTHLYQLEALAENSNFSSQDQMHLHYALFNANQKIGEYAQAFSHLNQANMLKRLDIVFDINTERTYFQMLKINGARRSHQPSILQGAGQKDAACISPIFIIGMPRSGTTLMERLVAQHPDVTAGGEMPFLHRLINQALKQRREPNLPPYTARLADEYIALARGLGVKTTYFTDKMPTNFRYVSQICSAFPKAKIIHIHRNKMASCFSIYSKYFSGQGNGFAYDQKELGAYHNLYENMMAHWRKLFPDQILNIELETFTSEPSSTAERIYAFLGLEWDAKYLNLDNKMLATSTASASQITKDIRGEISPQWENYRPFLADLINTLN